MTGLLLVYHATVLRIGAGAIAQANAAAAATRLPATLAAAVIAAGRERVSLAEAVERYQGVLEALKRE